jgi:hypothetical protein
MAKRYPAVRAMSNNASRNAGGVALRSSVFRLPPIIAHMPIRRAFS